MKLLIILMLLLFGCESNQVTQLKLNLESSSVGVKVVIFNTSPDNKTIGVSSMFNGQFIINNKNKKNVILTKQYQESITRALIPRETIILKGHGNKSWFFKWSDLNADIKNWNEIQCEFTIFKNNKQIHLKSNIAKVKLN